MSYKVEKIGGAHVLGEGPHWDDGQQVLFYVDAFASSVCRYVPKEKKLTVCKIDTSDPVSIIIPLKGKKDKFMISVGPQLAELTWNGESASPQNVRILTSVATRGADSPNFNDGKVDPSGRLWIGTLGKIRSDLSCEEGAGSLYSFTSDLTVKKHVDGITVGNGLAWSADGKTMYYIDTPTRKIDAFDYSAATGNISNRRAIYDLAQHTDVPETAGFDGMTIDTDGNLWVAVFSAGAVFNINPNTRKFIRKVDIPSPQTTSVAFGGANRDELYVVSANFMLPEKVKSQNPHVGATFRVTGLGVQGAPMSPFQLSV